MTIVPQKSFGERNIVPGDIVARASIDKTIPDIRGSFGRDLWLDKSTCYCTVRKI